MEFIQGIREIREAFDALESSVERDSWQIPKKIEESWAFMIHLTDAIDSGDYLRSVKWHPQQTEDGLMQWTVDTLEDPDVTYPGFVEGGTARMPARFPAQRGIEREDFVQSITQLVERPLGR